MNVVDKRVREFAYQIWQSEGEPEGQEMRHWVMACKLAEAERSAPPVRTEDSFPKLAKNSAAEPSSSLTENGETSGISDAGQALDSLESTSSLSR